MASGPLSITMISVKNIKARRVYLAASLSGDKSDNKQRTPVHKKGSTTKPWLGHTFKFTTLPDARLEFKIEKTTFFSFKKGCFLGRKTDVVGEVDVPVKDLLENGCAGDIKPKLLSCEVRSSSPKTKGKIVCVLEFSYEFGEPFPIEAAPELEEETVTASQAAAHHQTGNATSAYFYGPPAEYGPAAPLPPRRPSWNFLGRVGRVTASQAAANHQTGNATPAYFYGPPAGYGPTAPLPPRRPGWNFLGRVGITVAVNAITSAFNSLGFNGGDFTDAWI